MNVPDYSHLKTAQIVKLVSSLLTTADRMTETTNRVVMVARAKEAISLLPTPIKRQVLEALPSKHRGTLGEAADPTTITPME